MRAGHVKAICLATILLTLAVPALAGQDFHHTLNIELHPGRHLLSVEDEITLPEGAPTEIRFLLHSRLSPSSPTDGVKIVRAGKRGRGAAELYSVRLPRGRRSFTLVYRGRIHHPLRPVGSEQARGFSDTPGIISEEGAYLSPDSFWYPVFEGEMITFDLTVRLPLGWDAVSQGGRITPEGKQSGAAVRWKTTEPQEGIYLVASRFTEYVKNGKVTRMAFLRTANNELAERYLDAAGRYIGLYERLIGPYPYEKFALVENFWETGFGMPSFTLLGPRVLRLPFIIDSSYPHEILHNWWGNGVYPDFEKGNWSEGLTAYLADHLMKEQQGAAAEYRQTTLQKYADYVSGGRDFPLKKFHSRHSSSSEAIGYGKSLMFFHMLRNELGDAVFVGALRDFYRKKRFTIATFSDLRRSLESASGKTLAQEFVQWVDRTGAPVLKIKEVKVHETEKGYVLSAVIEQVQQGPAYRLVVPVAVTMQGRTEARQETVRMEGKAVRLTLTLPARPVRLDLDPEYDLFRRLDIGETPPAITQALGARKMLVVLPAAASMKMREAYRGLADSLAASGPDAVEVRLDSEMRSLPSDHAVVLLGWENSFFDTIAPILSRYDVSFLNEQLILGGSHFALKTHSVVLTGRSSVNREMPVMFIASPGAKPMAGLARKLPHYHKYSYLVFEGDEPVNVSKGRWPVFDSPLTVYFAGEGGTLKKAGMGKLAERKPLSSLLPDFSSVRMMDSIRFLASERLEGRGLGTAGLETAAEYIADGFKKAGLFPAGDAKDSYFQVWDEEIKNEDGGLRRFALKNVVGVLHGSDPALSPRCVIVGAHYDHLGRGWPDARAGNKGMIHPGADDNASGVAVLMELARQLVKGPPPLRSVVFVAFTAEEAGKMGSKHFVAANSPYRLGSCIGMANLDTVGRLDGKKLLVLGAGSAAEWVDVFSTAGFVSGVGVESVSRELDSSDQISFREAGIPAVQLFTGPHADYHRPGDTPDKIDNDGLIKVASVAGEVAEYLANRREPLTAIKKLPEVGAPGAGRKTGIGTIPDFSYSGRGFRLSGTVAGSPAEEAGLREGDVIIRINDEEIGGIRDFSVILATTQPGQRVRITFVREGKEMAAEAEVKAR